LVHLPSSLGPGLLFLPACLFGCCLVFALGAGPRRFPQKGASPHLFLRSIPSLECGPQAQGYGTVLQAPQVVSPLNKEPFLSYEGVLSLLTKGQGTGLLFPFPVLFGKNFPSDNPYNNRYAPKAVAVSPGPQLFLWRLGPLFAFGFTWSSSFPMVAMGRGFSYGVQLPLSVFYFLIFPSGCCALTITPHPLKSFLVHTTFFFTLV